MVAETGEPGFIHLRKCVQYIGSPKQIGFGETPGRQRSMLTLRAARARLRFCRSGEPRVSETYLRECYKFVAANSWSNCSI